MPFDKKRFKHGASGGFAVMTFVALCFVRPVAQLIGYCLKYGCFSALICVACYLIGLGFSSAEAGLGFDAVCAFGILLITAVHGNTMANLVIFSVCIAAALAGSYSIHYYRINRFQAAEGRPPRFSDVWRQFMGS